MPDSPSSSANRIASRRAFLQSQVGQISGGSDQAALQVYVPGTQAGDAPVSAVGMNLILFITDQERAVQWFPAGWAAKNLPAFTALSANGLSFERACANSCMCTPSRNTIFTGLFPAQHRSTDTLTEDFVQSDTEHQLDPTLPNLATVLKTAGYEVVYKGKWHLSKAVKGCDGTRQDDDLTRYGFDQWDAPDAGQDVKIENYGGGSADNDTRFLNDAIAYLEHKRDNPGDKPFCLVVSLVNPHDVLGYPGNVGTDGYTPDDLLGDIEKPPTIGENLGANLKPTAQQAILFGLNLPTSKGGLGPLLTDTQSLDYLNFYANLMKRVDGQLQRLLDVFGSDPAGRALRDQTLVIRTSDHGEMGLCHGGLRQKAFMCYEEILRVPLVWSNPRLFPESRETRYLVSHVDLLPTLCSLLGVPDWRSYHFAGVDYAGLLLDAKSPPVQDYVLFTFDDINAGQPATGTNGVAPAPNRLQVIREADYKYARYFDATGAQPDQEEFYDIRPASRSGTDVESATGEPVELRNLSEWAENQRPEGAKLATDEQAAIRARMKQRLADVTAARLQSLPYVAPVDPSAVTVRVITVGDDASGAQTERIEIRFVSRWGTNYQLQTSVDRVVWTDVVNEDSDATAYPVAGNNGPVVFCQPLPSEAVFYRVLATAA